MWQRIYLINLMYLEFVKYFKLKKDKHFNLHVSLFCSSFATFIVLNRENKGVLY